MSTQCPIVVDLDGTLINTDLLWETASRYVLKQPLFALNLLRWLAQGRAELKGHLAAAAPLDGMLLPYNEALLHWLKSERAAGKRLVLATASHSLLAQQVAQTLDLFEEVIATEGDVNLKSEAKRQALVERFGDRGFDYVGNDWADVAVWKSARIAHVVGGSRRLLSVVRANGNMGHVFSNERPSMAAALLSSMRPHQWLKNLLVLVPLLAAHRYFDLFSLQQAALAFFIFSVTASSVYLLNDLVDLAADRHHVRKKSRPLAAGHLSLLHGWIAWPMLLCTAYVSAFFWLPERFIVSLSLYFTLTALYSLWLKRLALIDVISLAGLYTLRIVAGAAAIGVPLSFWLLACSIFLFLSLAFVKRYSELKVARDKGETGELRGRGYQPQDIELVSSLGCSAGYLSVLVLALYIQDTHTSQLYSQPMWIWMACPLLLWWVSRAWLIAHRGGMHDDPIVFALKDRVSWVILLLLGTVFILAKVSG